MAFTELSPKEWGANPFEAIGKQWMLITAGGREACNTMTASWGGVGVLWGRDVAFIVVRPQRYTREFIERQERFSLSFFREGWREQLNLCGTKSGRDVDKIAACGFTPVYDYGAPCFAEADDVLICRKLYAQDMTGDCFLDQSLPGRWYPEKDYHRLYVGEIENVLRKA